MTHPRCLPTKQVIMTHRHWALFFFFVALCQVSQASYCRKNDGCWPAVELWEQLNQTVGGYLLPVGNELPSVCEQVGDVSTQISEESVCMQAPNCLRANCSYDPAEPLLLPSYVLEARESSHIQAAFTFAAQNRIQVVVKSSGHDYNGRSTAASALLVWMRHFQQDTLEIVPQFQDSCGGTSIPGVRVPGGASWREVYDLVDNDWLIVGGHAFSVGASGGYVAGGGLSVLSASLGLAVDNVLAMQVITPDAQVLEVDACKNTDLFWALRGGGGGTFGVVTSVVHRLHPKPDTISGLLFYMPTSRDDPSFESIHHSFVNNWTRFAPTLDRRWGGFTLGYFNTLFLYFNGPHEEAIETIAPLKEWYDTEVPMYWKIMRWAGWDLQTYDSYLHRHGPQTDETGHELQTASWLIPTEWMLEESNLDTLVEYMKAPVAYGFQVVIHQLGGAMGDPDVNTSSVSSAMRAARWSVAGNAGFVNSVRDLIPGSGCYLNECWVNEPAWKEAFWGENYGRLLEIKQRVDPHSVLDCFHCVGSEELAASSTLSPTSYSPTASPTMSPTIYPTPSPTAIPTLSPTQPPTSSVTTSAELTESLNSHGVASVYCAIRALHVYALVIVTIPVLLLL